MDTGDAGKELQPDEVPKHLWLGITHRGLRLFVKKIGFDPKQQASNTMRLTGGYLAHGEDCESMACESMSDAGSSRHWCNCWRTGTRREHHSHGSTGYDFCDAVRGWLRERGAVDRSVCQELLDIGDEYIGDEHVSWAHEIGQANVFYSHMQKLGIDETLETLGLTVTEAIRFRLACQTRRYWVDYLVIRQLAGNDFKTAEIACVIGTIGCTMVEGDAALDYIRRSFCIFEVGATTAAKGKLHWVQKEKLHWVACRCACLEKLYAWRSAHKLFESPPVDSRAAQAYQPRDKEAIDAFILQRHGSFEKNDQLVSEAINSALRYNKQVQLVHALFELAILAILGVAILILATTLAMQKEHNFSQPIMAALAIAAGLISAIILPTVMKMSACSECAHDCRIAVGALVLLCGLSLMLVLQWLDAPYEKRALQVVLPFLALTACLLMPPHHLWLRRCRAMARFERRAAVEQHREADSLCV